MCGLAFSACSLASGSDHFDIPAGDLVSALDLLVRQSHVELIYSADDLRGLRTSGVRGDVTAETAVHKLLEGTDLEVRMHPSGAILITRNRTLSKRAGPPQAPAEPSRTAPASTKESRQMEEIVVSGTAEGLVATRTATPLREIPQTVALISSEQMRQLNDANLANALAHTPGITVVRNDSLDDSFYARGFKITSFHVDGGAALFNVTGFQQLDTAPMLTLPFLGTTDLSEFDHIEVLRGADALFANNGNPGATVSLVRKRPLRSPQFTFDTWVGSWNNTRAEADATGPLAFDGALRGRVDGLYTDRDYFYDSSSFRRRRLFAALDYDLTPITMVTVGGSYQWDDALPFVSGLPRNQDGSDPNLSRKTALTFNWASYRSRTGEIYFQLWQQLGTSWKLTANATAWNGTVEAASGTFNSQVDPLTGGLGSPPSYLVSPRPNTLTAVAAAELAISPAEARSP
jgi:outer-membrane receptor for ferric coprogen and ferric-rhodotorulic acid